MTSKYIFLIYLILLCFSSYCQTTNTSKLSPEIIGTPPPFRPGSVNDPSLVSQYIRSIFQDSKGNFWFAPAGQSVARYDEKTLKYYSKIEFFHGNK